MLVEIVKYPNGNLYSPTLGENLGIFTIAKILKKGDYIFVVEKETGEDVTCIILMNTMAALYRLKASRDYRELDSLELHIKAVKLFDELFK